MGNAVQKILAILLKAFLCSRFKIAPKSPKGDF